MKNNILKINQIIIFLFISAINPAYSQTYTSWITGSIADVTTTATGGACLMGRGTDNDDAIISYNSINSSCGTYKYVDTEYYTLNVISGTAKISKTKEAEFDNTTVALYPNPAKDLVGINFLSEQKQEGQILI